MVQTEVVWGGGRKYWEGGMETNGQQTILGAREGGRKNNSVKKPSYRNNSMQKRPPVRYQQCHPFQVYSMGLMPRKEIVL